MLIEDRIARWRNQESGKEEEGFVELLCDAEEELREMRKDQKEILRLLVNRLHEELRGFTVTYKPLLATFAIDSSEIHRIISVVCRCFSLGRDGDEKDGNNDDNGGNISRPPWENPSSSTGEYPGGLCCQRATRKFCYEHDPMHYPLVTRFYWGTRGKLRGKL
jgi:hypothetical protein